MTTPGFKQTPCGEIPEEWECVELKQVCAQMASGGTPSRKVAKYWDGNIPWITGADIVNQRISEIRRCITQEATKNSATVVCAKGSVLLVTRTGVGKMARAPFDVAVSQDITMLVAEQRICKPDYLYWVLNGSQARLGAGTQGTSINGLLRDDLKAFPIPLPPLSEQRRIAEILDDVDDAIEKSKAVIEQIKVVKKGLTQQLLTRGIPGRHTRFKKTPIGMIPEEWEVTALSSIAKVQTGIAKNTKSRAEDTVTLPYLRVANVQDGFVDLSELKRISIPTSRVACYNLRQGDVLFTEGGDFDKLGRGCVWEGQVEPCLHQNHVFAVRCSDRILPHFLAAYAASPTGKTYFLNASKQTTNLASINSTQLKQLPVPVPSIEEQREVLSLSKRVHDCLISVENATEVISKTKTGIMQELLNGKRRVTDA